MKIMMRVLIVLALLLLGVVLMFAQDSPASLDQRWAEAGTTAAPLSVNRLAPRGVAPHPGYWHCGTAGWFRYCPCYPLPYTDWTDPETLTIGYFRYDFSPLPHNMNSACGLIPQPCVDGQGGPNHTQQAIGGGYTIPLEPQPDVNNYYPVPEVATGLWAIWAQFNTPPPAFPGVNYAQNMKSNPVWVTGYNYKKPAMDADPGCQGGAVTPTITKTPTPVPSPTRTPTPAPNQFGRYITWATEKGIMAGCGGGNFCPGTPVNGLLTRAQYCATTFNAFRIDHPEEPLPACKPLYLDVICGAP